MTEKLNMKRICAVDSYRFLDGSVYYSKSYDTYSYNDYHPCCCTCTYLFDCPYNGARSKSRHDKDTLCMKYVHYNYFNKDLVYLKYHNDNSRRRYVLMSAGIPYEYDKTLF